MVCVFYYIGFNCFIFAYSFLFVTLHLFASCLQFRQLGTNAGEAFGAVGIGVYGKRWLTRGKELRIEFNYRSHIFKKSVQQVRLRVESAEEADSVIRSWLQNRATKKAVSISSKSKSQPLFLSPISKYVLQPSYHEHHNRKRKFGRRSQTPKPVSSTSSVIEKLRRSRYAELKRAERAHAKAQQQLQVFHHHVLMIQMQCF